MHLLTFLSLFVARLMLGESREIAGQQREMSMTEDRSDDWCAKLYKDSNQGGVPVTVKAGTKVNKIKDEDCFGTQCRNGKEWNDKISSLVVNKGCLFAGYDNDGMKKHLITLNNLGNKRSTARKSWFNVDWQNDKMTSYTCFCQSDLYEKLPDKPCAILYSEENFQGDQLPIPLGEADTYNKKDYSKWQNRMKSVKVACGCMLDAKDFPYMAMSHEYTGELKELPAQRTRSWNCKCGETFKQRCNKEVRCVGSIICSGDDFYYFKK